MPLNKLLRAGDHEDLAEERQKATFDTDEMAAIIWESKEVWFSAAHKYSFTLHSHIP